MQYSVDRETRIKSIKSLDKQIEEGKGDIIQLKRIRNSLLDISTLPPEILIPILELSITWEQCYRLFPATNFNKPIRGPGCILLVCHYWYEVASRSSEYGSLGRNTLKDWTKWSQHPQAGSGSVDLVLKNVSYEPEEVSPELQDKLRYCAIQDKI